MKKAVTIIFAFIFISACADKQPFGVLDETNPIVNSMPDIQPDMNNAGFWIARSAAPDDIILDSVGIEQLNQEIAEKGETVTISEYDEYKSSKFILDSINILYNAVANRKLYNENGRLITKGYLAGIVQQMNLSPLETAPMAEQKISFGVITERVDQKLIPTLERYRNVSNGYFDRLVMSSLDIGTPVAILWASMDNRWLYVRSPLTVGWVPVNTVATSSQENAARWESLNNGFIVSTAYKTSIYSNKDMTIYSGWIPLGGKLPFYSTENSGTGAGGEYIEVGIPARGAGGELAVMRGYIKSKDVNIGYLPYTSRNMIELAFEFLHAPYGWGGMNGEEDCSGFIKQIFSAVGITLPRNSGEQGKLGDNLLDYRNDSMGNNTVAAKQELLQAHGIPGATLLQMPGHIMLYLGGIGDNVYAIHAMWSFEELHNGKRVPKISGRVVVSHLNLSAHMPSGNYLNRLTNIVVMRPDTME